MREFIVRTQVRVWLAVFGASTLVLGGSFVMIQQTNRMSANDLPLTISQQVTSSLEAGSSPTDLVSLQKINLKTDNGTFVIVTDSSRHVLASSATLDGQTPLPPEGVFKYTSEHGTDQITWEPKTNVRIALKVNTYGKSPNDGFVLTGQPLRQVEKRISFIFNICLVTWLAVLAWSSYLLLIPEYRLSRSK